MADADRPSLELARRVLPPGLLAALEAVFGQGLSGCMLVGGTAIAGFYAGHRRSDDIDLFVQDSSAHEAAVLAVESLAGAGGSVRVLRRTAQFYKAACRFRGHAFAADVALHAPLFREGKAHGVGGLVVASLETLLMLKAAALVSRCSEKDLYDALWLFRHFEATPLERVVELAMRIDGGATAEGLLIAISGAKPVPESCGFALDPAQEPARVCSELLAFQRELLSGLRRLAEKAPAPPLGELLRRLKRLR